MMQQPSLVTMYAQYTPSDCFDIRCEYEVPRFLDLGQLDDILEPEDEYLLQGAFDLDTLPRKISQEEEFYQWFQIAHDFKVPRKIQKITKEHIVKKLLPPKNPSQTQIQKQQQVNQHNMVHKKKQSIVSNNNNSSFSQQQNQQNNYNNTHSSNNSAVLTYSNNNVQKSQSSQSIIVDVKTVASTNSSGKQSSTQTKSPINKDINVVQLQHSQSTKNNGGQSQERSILSAKNRNSRNQLKRTQSQMMNNNNGVSKMAQNQSMKSIDLNLNSSSQLVNMQPQQQITQNIDDNQCKQNTNNNSLFQKLSKHQPTKSTIDNITIDLVSLHENSTASTQNILSQRIMNMSKQNTDRLPITNSSNNLHLQNSSATNYQQQQQSRSRERLPPHHTRSGTSGNLAQKPIISNNISHNHSKSRTDYIQQNKERVKQISAHSKTRKQSTVQGNTSNNGILNNEQNNSSSHNLKANVTYFNQTQSFNETQQLKPTLKNIKSQQTFAKSKNQTQNISIALNHSSNISNISKHVNHTNSKSQLKTARTNVKSDNLEHTISIQNLSSMLKEPQSIKRKRNGRVHSMMWGANSASTQNLVHGLNSSKSNNALKQSQVHLKHTESIDISQHTTSQQNHSSALQYSKIQENDQNHTSNISTSKTYTNKSPIAKQQLPSQNTHEKENLIQSQYLKQLLKMQQKYHNLKGHMRNQHSQSGISNLNTTSNRIAQGLNNFDKTTNNLMKSNSKSRVLGSQHKATHSFSKQKSSANISVLLNNNNVVNNENSIINNQSKSIQKGYHKVNHSKNPSFISQANHSLSHHGSNNNNNNGGSQTQRDPLVSQINLTNNL